MEDINQMRERHKQEIETLQKNCKHRKQSNWIEEWWAIGHSTGNEVKVCEFCGKVIKRKELKFKYMKIKNVGIIKKGITK